MDVSIVIPLLNEEESLPELSNWIVRVVTVHNLNYEVIMVDDGSTDYSWNVIRQIACNNAHFKGIKLQNFNCGLKAYKDKVVKSVEVYGEMHRYIPVLAKLAGFRKVGEKIVEHRPRKYGITKFGWNRFINGFLDLLTLAFVGRFGKR